MKKRGFGAGLWNGTGGKIVEGESAKETAKREVMEEFGVEVEIIDLLSLGKIDFVFKDGLNYKVYIFKTRIKRSCQNKITTDKEEKRKDYESNNNHRTWKHSDC